MTISSRLQRLKLYKTCRWMGTLVLIFCAGAFGYYFNALCDSAPNTLAVPEKIPLEYYLSWHSFSEVDEAKALLEASAEQFIQELREQHFRETRSHNGTLASSLNTTAASNRALQAVEQRMATFEGTAQELLLIKEYLCLLWAQHNYQRWFEVYLSVIYQHPTHKLIGLLAGRAMEYSRILGKEKELYLAFQFLQANLMLPDQTRQALIQVLSERSAVAGILPRPKDTM